MSAPADLQGLPWPEGEPEALRSASGRLRGVAGGFEGAGMQLGSATPAGWSGFAQSSYTGSLSRAGEAVTYMSTSLDTGATALTELAGVIEQAQEKVRTAADGCARRARPPRAHRPPPRTPAPRPRPRRRRR